MWRRAVLFGGLATLVSRYLNAATPGIYITENGEVLGPFDEVTLKDRIKSVAEAEKTLVWHQGMADWKPATQVPALSAFVAALPAETPFDFATHVIGNWLSIDALIEFKSYTYIGRHTLSFGADGTYSGRVYFQYIKQLWKPDPAGGGQQFVDESVYLDRSQSGKYKIEPHDLPGKHIVKFDGETVSLQNGDSRKADPEKFGKLFEIVTPDHMTTSLGENFRRQP